MIQAISGNGGAIPAPQNAQAPPLAPAACAAWPAWCCGVLAGIGDAVLACDLHGRVRFLNPAAEHLTGWTSEEAAGATLEDVFRTVDRDITLAVGDSAIPALREGALAAPASDRQLVAKDGARRSIDESVAPILGAGGTCVGEVRVFRDVTEHRLQERHLREALSYADNIVSAMREPLLVLDRHLRVLTANRSFCQTFHTSREETEGRLIHTLGNGQWNVPRLKTLLQNVLSDARSVNNCDIEHDFPAIGRRIMLLNARPFDASGNLPDLILLAIEDITERRQAEIAVQTSELRYRRLFQSAKDGILILDADSLTIIDANRFITELLGYSHDELMGKELWQIGFFGDKPASQAVYQQLKTVGYVRYDHLPLETKGGEKAEVEFISNVYQVDQRAVAQCNIRDISERCRMERLLQEQTEALADLHRRKDEFLAMLSHELRSPLAPIANAVHLLRLHKHEDQLQRQARAIIERQVSQLTRLVDDLMDVSRISTGRVQLRRELVTMNGIVESAVETTQPLMDQYGHQLQVTPSAQPIMLYADAARLEQVLVNLLTNAAKYTEAGGRVWLSVEQVGDECVLRLRDTGVGIAPALLPHIFELFTQAERSLDRSSGGLGIGLALVQRLVELHGGRVQVRSTLGEGSEFTVYLPVAHAAAPRPALPLAPLYQPPLRALKVLVVDDNVDAAESLAMLVATLGHEAQTAHDGAAALRQAAAFRPDVVLLDIGLPGLTGYEVAARLRREAAQGHVVLVAVTGYGLEVDKRQSQQAGFDHHLVKPANFEQLQQILATVAERAN